MMDCKTCDFSVCMKCHKEDRDVGKASLRSTSSTSPLGPGATSPTSAASSGTPPLPAATATLRLVDQHGRLTCSVMVQKETPMSQVFAALHRQICLPPYDPDDPWVHFRTDDDVILPTDSVQSLGLQDGSVIIAEMLGPLSSKRRSC